MVLNASPGGILLVEISLWMPIAQVIGYGLLYDT